MHDTRIKPWSILAPMEILTIGLLFALLCAAYIQTVTGFAFGMIVMGSVILFGLAPIPETAVVISITGFVNSIMGLWRHRKDVQWHQIWPLMLAQIPFVFVGIEILLYLSALSIYALETLMGVTVMVASLILLIRPPKLQRTSGTGSFTLTGAASGTLTGLFAAGGPPLVYLLYRQPWPIVQIKACLFAIFTLSTLLRIGFVAGQGDLPIDLALLGLISLPIIVLGTKLANRFPPPLSPEQQKRCAFALFGLMGLSLASMGTMGLINGV